MQSAPSKNVASVVLVDPMAYAPRVSKEAWSTALFNLCFMFRKMPAFQCEYRTVLVRKTGASPRDMGTWRPITVGNLLLRILCSVIAIRLSSSMPIHEIQFGFVPCDGIAEKSLLFARILKDGNTVTDETAIVLLD
ncbi:hypothetical protein AVEN_137528-1 [Araneus ventricosus]|uniref:Reverse transcriptase domain-containing protein n=1 Tax=Araneus ventricosus TaxID=182803 RepID=A0A4Y2JR02_ARAVE|nr:hypothetical protein AVEN_137528-1 [Araneus ventricosus]